MLEENQYTIYMCKIVKLQKKESIKIFEKVGTNQKEY